MVSLKRRDIGGSMLLIEACATVLDCNLPANDDDWVRVLLCLYLTDDWITMLGDAKIPLSVDYMNYLILKTVQVQ